jgi:hypothetical protein
MTFVSASAKRRKNKIPHSEIIRRLRLGDLRKLIGDRCRGGKLPDDDAGIEYLRELLLPISIGPHEASNAIGGIRIWGPNDRMRQEIARWAPWMGDNRIGALLDEINQMPTWQRKPKARTLGDRLNVTYRQRQELQLRTIAPCDVSDAAMELIRKRKRRRRDKGRRRDGRRMQLQKRADYLAAHAVNRTKPWIVAGVSRASWYRQRETSPPAPNKPYTDRCSRPVSPSQPAVRKKGAARANSSHPVSNQTSHSQKPEMPVIDNQPELVVQQTCLTTEQTGNPMLPPGVTEPVPAWVLMLPPDMAAMATVAWFYGSLTELPKTAAAA